MGQFSVAPDRRVHSFAVCALAGLFVLFAAAPARGQITFSFTYGDVQQGLNQGFNQSGGVGTARQQTMTGVGDYLETILDGRGSVNVSFARSNSQIPAGSGTLAFCGTGYLTNYNTGGPPIPVTGVQPGVLYQKAVQNTQPFGGPTGSASSISRATRSSRPVPWHRAPSRPPRCPAGSSTSGASASTKSVTRSASSR